MRTWHVGQVVAVHYGWSDIERDTVAKVGKRHFTLTKFNHLKFRVCSGRAVSNAFNAPRAEPWTDEIEAEFKRNSMIREARRLIDKLGRNRNHIKETAEAVVPHLRAAVAAMEGQEGSDENT